MSSAQSVPIALARNGNNGTFVVQRQVVEERRAQGDVRLTARQNLAMAPISEPRDGTGCCAKAAKLSSVWAPPKFDDSQSFDTENLLPRFRPRCHAMPNPH